MVPKQPESGSVGGGTTPEPLLQLGDRSDVGEQAATGHHMPGCPRVPLLSIGQRIGARDDGVLQIRTAEDSCRRRILLRWRRW